MLGIRHFQGTAIDLWLGPVEFFVCDCLYILKPGNEISKLEILPLENGEHSAINIFGVSPTQDLNLLIKTLCKLTAEKGLRHFSLAKDPEAQSFSLAEIFQPLKEELSKQSSPKQRISFITNTAEEHESCQNMMFAAFSE
mgnify:CR=1 FL=1